MKLNVRQFLKNKKNIRCNYNIFWTKSSLCWRCLMSKHYNKSRNVNEKYLIVISVLVYMILLLALSFLLSCSSVSSFLTFSSPLQVMAVYQRFIDPIDKYDYSILFFYILYSIASQTMIKIFLNKIENLFSQKITQK